MIGATIIVKPLAEKRKEVLQTIDMLIQQIRLQKGCVIVEVHTEEDDKNTIRLVETWKTQSDFDEHMRSKAYRVLLGTTYLLVEPPKVKLNEKTQ